MVRSNFFSAVALISLNLGGQAVNAAFSIYDADSLDTDLSSGCIGALSAPIDCIPFVQSFQHLSYRTDLELELTNNICTKGCYDSLKVWFDTVSDKCAGKSVRGGIPTKLGGYMWSGYNETCTKDPRPPRAYCNDVIANFTLVPNIESMPRTELCHACNVRRLAMMQSTQYSMYDEHYKRELEYIYGQCGIKGPTDIPPPLETVQPVPAPYCLSNKRYVTQKGDTCDSIAKGNSVSAASLYMGNQDVIKDCANITPGVSVCIPLTCVTHLVTEKETCFSIEQSLGLKSGSVQQFNSWIDAGCINLQTSTDFYGKAICVSPQGGTFVNPTTPPVANPTPKPADGYSQSKTAPPEGAVVAEGTTLNCGKWHVVAADDSCVKICLTNGIDTTLFHEVNPSLGAAGGCDASLKEKTALCTGPTYVWKENPISTPDS